MITRIVFALACALMPFVALAQDTSVEVFDNSTDIFAQKSSRKNFIFQGSLCMTVEHFHVADTNYQFWECAPLSETTANEFNLTALNVGTWEQRDCPRGFQFDEAEQRCEEQRKVRRQQSLCATNPTPQCPQMCNANNNNPTIGTPCNWQTARLMVDPASTSYFLQCAPQPGSNSCGQWVRMPCAPNTQFQVSLQVCLAPQQQPTSTCPQQQAPVCGCAQNTCPGSLSCQAPTQTCCGQVQQPIYQPQPIYPQPVYTPAPVYQLLRCSSGSLPFSNICVSCPFGSMCESNVGCCPRTSLPPPTSAVILVYQTPSCPGNQPAVCGCSVGCPQQTSCHAPTQGCCPIQQPQPIVQRQPMCPNGIPAIQTCPTGQCPQGSSCYNGGCCPSACPQQQQFQSFCGYNSRCPQQTNCYQPTQCCCQQQAPPRCPNGQNAVSTCSSAAQCSNGMECVNGGCCPLPNCPTGVPSSGRCPTEGASCGVDGLCTAGLCGPMPSCPSGVSSVGPCIQGQCPLGNECSNGVVCCPLPTCPEGAVASSRCQVNGQQCGVNALCQNGLCCPMPMCPNNLPAQSPCNNGQCQSGSECVNGLICCALPQCPRGGVATSRCPVNGAACGVNASCQNGLCCPMPMCPNGQPGRGVCTNGQCPQGTECANGVCCALPQCPTGVPASQRCTGICPTGQSCQNGVCCPMPPCPSGVMPSATCTGDFQCGPGQGCTNGGCCPLPSCPSGVIPSQRCQQGSLCPTGQICQNGVCCASCPNGQPPMNPCQQGCQYGFSCVANVGCCALPPTPAPQPICPPVQQPVCQCGVQNTCPQQSSCNTGTCCTQPTSPIAGVQPGYGCQASNQCNGYNAGCAQCVQSSCACTNSAWSNGVGCQQTNVQVMYQARTSCNQMGGGCQIGFNAARRKPVFHGGDDDGAKNSTNLWFLVSGERKCPKTTTVDGKKIDGDATCLPNEMCIDGICQMKLWPGEYGCQTDRECSSRCARGYCEANTDKSGVGQCRCKDSFLLFGKCLDECPEGTTAKNDECHLDDEEGFWKNLRMQSLIRDVLQSAKC